MAKAVFIASSHSTYKDRPGEVYHFPNRNYLSRVAETVGDWVIFYEGRAGGNRGYYAIQRIDRIAPDPTDPSHSFAILDRGSELSFDTNVPRLRPDGRPYETGLPDSGGSNASAVRMISDADFAAIVDAGLRYETGPNVMPRQDEIGQIMSVGFAEGEVPFDQMPLRQFRPEILVSRKFRDQAFARQVKAAYGARCAMSGLEIRNGGGRPEVEAAHILPVEKDGPDTVRNGLALSGTLHWMFDRGLISVDADNSLLVAKDSIADEVADRLLVADRMLIVPRDPSMRPHQGYLEWHRRNCFKG